MKSKETLEYAFRFAFWATIPIASSSAYMTYRGVMMTADDVVVSVCYAVAVGSVIMLLTTLNARILPALSEGKIDNKAWAAYFISAIAIISTSSYTNLVCIAGEKVKELDARHHVERIQETISQTSISVQSAQNTVTSLIADRDRFYEMGEQERSSGLLSKNLGEGMITAAFFQASNIMDSAANALKSKKSGIDSLIERANQILSDMRDILDTKDDIDTKSRELSKLNRELQTAFEELAATNLLQVIENSLGALDGIIAVSTTNNAKLKRTQDKVFEAIKNDLQKTAERYLGGKKLKHLDAPAYPIWEPRFEPRLLLAYSHEIIPYIAGAIAVDAAPLIIIILLIVLSKHIKENDEDSLIENRSVKIAQFRDILELINEIQASPKDGGRHE